MKHELKVILGETVHDTVVYVDNQPIGLIQNIKLQVGLEMKQPEIEIVFPNLFSPQIDANYQKNSVMVEELKRYIRLLNEIPNVRVLLKDIDFTRP